MLDNSFDHLIRHKLQKLKANPTIMDESQRLIEAYFASNQIVVCETLLSIGTCASQALLFEIFLPVLCERLNFYNLSRL